MYRLKTPKRQGLLKLYEEGNIYRKCAILNNILAGITVIDDPDSEALGDH